MVYPANTIRVAAFNSVCKHTWTPKCQITELNAVRNRDVKRKWPCPPEAQGPGGMGAGDTGSWGSWSTTSPWSRLTVASKAFDGGLRHLHSIRAQKVLSNIHQKRRRRLHSWSLAEASSAAGRMTVVHAEILTLPREVHFPCAYRPFRSLSTWSK